MAKHKYSLTKIRTDPLKLVCMSKQTAILKSKIFKRFRNVRKSIETSGGISVL